MSWFVYLIECQDGSLYTGITNDVQARFAAHISGKGARYTRSHPPKRLFKIIAYPDRVQASKAEYHIKRLTPHEKRKLASTPSILFVCHGNTCRSVLAQSIASQILPPTISLCSAGLFPHTQRQAPTQKILNAEYGLKAPTYPPLPITAFDLNAFDLVIVLDASLTQSLPAISKKRLLVWNIPDPYQQSEQAYKKCAKQIKTQITKLARRKSLLSQVKFF